MNLKENFVIIVLASILYLTLSYNNKRESMIIRTHIEYELIYS